MGVGPIEGMDKIGWGRDGERDVQRQIQLAEMVTGEEPCCSGTAIGFPGRR